MSKSKKNKKKNKKGFSMVEILAVVVILGIVSTIGIVSVTRILDKSRQHYYETQESQLISAAQAYAANNSSIRPKNLYESKKIKLQELYDKKYIKEKILDQNKNICNPNKSYVEIYKSSKTDYKYVGYLNCPACEGNNGYCKIREAGDEPTIQITFPSGAQGNNLFSDLNEIEIKLFANGKNALIGSYSYKIYVNNALKYDSTTKINNKVNQKTIKEKINKFLPGKIKVVVTLTNSEGVTVSKAETRDYTDNLHPECGKISYDGAHQMSSYNTGETKTCGTSGYSWINIGTSNGTRQAWIVCNDLEGIGCSQHEFSKVLKNEGKTDTIEIKDTKGNKYNCEVMNCIDKTSPSMVVKVFKASSSGEKTGSAVYTHTINAQKNSVDYKPDANTYTTWMNGYDYPYGVYVEVTVADSLSRIKTLNWKQNDKNKKFDAYGDINQTVENKDGINLDSYTTHQVIKDDGARKEVIVTTDYAGNKVTGTVILKIDRTPPTVPTVNGYKKNNSTNVSSESGLASYSFNTWYKGYVLAKASGSTDAISGVEGYYLTTIGQESDANNIKQDYRNVNVLEGVVTIKFRAKDVAGNYSDYNEKIVKLDRKAPTNPTVNGYKKSNSSSLSCSASVSGLSSYSSNTWYNGYVYTKASGSTDGGSGGIKYYLTTTGQSSDVTDANQSCRNVNIQGTVTNTYHTCDDLGNCNTGTEFIIKLDRCEAKEIKWGSWSSCSVSCGGGTKTRTGTYYSTVPNHTTHTCGTKDDSASCNTQSCSTTVRLCRVGNTCLNAWKATTPDACYYTASYGTEFQCEDAGDGYWKIVKGTYKGYYIRAHCTGTTTCSASTCPDL